MRALASDQARRFAWLMACGARSATAAAKGAGYSDVKGGAKVRAHELMHNPKVLEAIVEASRSVLLGLAPMAISAARRILEDPKHPSHGRMVEAVLDRTGFSAKTEHKVTVEHTADLRELEDFARRLAAETGVSADRLLGVNAPKLIEGQVVSRETNDRPADA